MGLEDLDQEAEEEDHFDLSALKGSIPAKLKDLPSELSDYLLHLLADTVGCRPEELFGQSESAEKTEKKELTPSKPLDNSSAEEDLEQLFNSIEPEEQSNLAEPSLWDLAEAELENSNTEGEDLELNQLVKTGNRDALLVLFDAALSALEDTKLEQSYKTKIKVSENKQIEVDELSIVFEKYTDAVVEEHKHNFHPSRKTSVSNPPNDFPPIDFKPVELIRLTKSTLAILALKSCSAGFVAASIHLWFFDLVDSSREAILSSQLLWLALPYLAKNLGLSLVLSSIIFFFWRKNRTYALIETSLTI